MKTQAQFMNAKISDLYEYFAQTTSLLDKQIGFNADKGLIKGVDEFGNEVVVKKNQYAEYDVYIKTGEGEWDEEPVKTVHLKTTEDGNLLDVKACKTILLSESQEPHLVGKESQTKSYGIRFWASHGLVGLEESSKKDGYHHRFEKGEEVFWVEDASKTRSGGRRHWLHGDEIISDLKEEKGKDNEDRSATLKKVLEARTREDKKAALKEFHSQQSPVGVKRRTALKFDR